MENNLQLNNTEDVYDFNCGTGAGPWNGQNGEGSAGYMGSGEGSGDSSITTDASGDIVDNSQFGSGEGK